VDANSIFWREVYSKEPDGRLTTLEKACFEIGYPPGRCLSIHLLDRLIQTSFVLARECAYGHGRRQHFSNRLKWRRLSYDEVVNVVRGRQCLSRSGREWESRMGQRNRDGSLRSVARMFST
jgi:hypothetical protein